MLRRSELYDPVYKVRYRRCPVCGAPFGCVAKGKRRGKFPIHHRGLLSPELCPGSNRKWSRAPKV